MPRSFMRLRSLRVIAACPERSRRAPADLTRHRAEVNILEVGLRLVVLGAQRCFAVDARDRLPGEELRRDHASLALQWRQLVLRDDATPDAAAQIFHRAQRLRLE